MNRREIDTHSPMPAPPVQPPPKLDTPPALDAAVKRVLAYRPPRRRRGKVVELSK